MPDTTKLNKLVAVQKGTKQVNLRDVTNAYQKLQQPALFNGSTRTYKPTEEGGETLPDETTKVQTTVDDQLTAIRKGMTRVFDAQSAVDYGNLAAIADVGVDGTTIFEGAPTPFLLSLEKYLTDLRTVISHAPLLDPATDWAQDPASGYYKSVRPEVKNRTAKRLEAKVLYQHTDKHPAQVESFTVDAKVGEYETVKFSGAMSRARQEQLLDRINDLQRAVKFAREQANSTEVEEVKVGDAIFDYLFAD